MLSRLRYGSDSVLNLEIAGDRLMAECHAPRGEPLADPGEAVEAALAEPLEFPPLVQAALPGDRVVLALEAGVPQAATIVARTVLALVSSGVQAADITVVHARNDQQAADDALAELPSQIRHAVTSLAHDPNERQSLSYLAASHDAKPIYVNRALHEADLVIAIGCLRVAGSLGYHGISSGIFPAFSDEENVQRYRAPKSLTPGERKRLRKQADEVRWLLGLQFTVQVVPGVGEEILHVLAGEVDAVFREGSRLCEQAWSYSVPSRASLVVATIEGDADQQTWDNVARALDSASHAISEDGSVVICTELAEELGPALQRLVGAEDLEEALNEISRERPRDSLPAIELAHALARGKVYLVSHLDEETVEDLGVSPVAATQLSKLASRYDSCILLANAQYAAVHALDEVREEPLTKRESRR